MRQKKYAPNVERILRGRNAITVKGAMLRCVQNAVAQNAMKVL